MLKKLLLVSLILISKCVLGEESISSHRKTHKAPYEISTEDKHKEVEHSGYLKPELALLGGVACMLAIFIAYTLKGKYYYCNPQEHIIHSEKDTLKESSNCSSDESPGQYIPKYSEFFKPQVTYEQVLKFTQENLVNIMIHEKADHGINQDTIKLIIDNIKSDEEINLAKALAENYRYVSFNEFRMKINGLAKEIVRKIENYDKVLFLVYGNMEKSESWVFLILFISVHKIIKNLKNFEAIKQKFVFFGDTRSPISTLDRAVNYCESSICKKYLFLHTDDMFYSGRQSLGRFENNQKLINTNCEIDYFMAVLFVTSMAKKLIESKGAKFFDETEVILTFFQQCIEYSGAQMLLLKLAAKESYFGENIIRTVHKYDEGTLKLIMPEDEYGDSKLKKYCKKNSIIPPFHVVFCLQHKIADDYSVLDYFLFPKFLNFPWTIDTKPIGKEKSWQKTMRKNRELNTENKILKNGIIKNLPLEPSSKGHSYRKRYPTFYKNINYTCNGERLDYGTSTFLINVIGRVNL